MAKSTKMNFKKQSEIVLGVLMTIFIVMDYKLPYGLSQFIGTSFGKLTVVATVAYLTMCNPVLGFVSFFVALKMLNQHVAVKYTPSEHKKMKAMTSFNEMHKSLEEEIVGKMKPLKMTKSSAPYQPVLSSNHDATTL